MHLRHPEKILIVSPSWIGDALLAQTLYKLLKENHKATIDVLAPQHLHPLLKLLIEIDNIIELPFKHGELGLMKRYRLAKKLRQNNYTEIIVLPNSFKSALIPWWSKIPKRTGWLGEHRYGLLNNIHFLDKLKNPRMIDRYAALAFEPNASKAVEIPLPNLTISQSLQHHCLEKFNLSNTQNPILVLCPGAEFGPAKRWPSEYFIQLANHALKNGWQVWVLGAPSDRPSLGKLAHINHPHYHFLVGLTQLDEAITLLSCAQFVISNDSGLMHIASAFNKPLIAIYGPTSPAFAPPLSSNAKSLSLSLDCSPCRKRNCPLVHHRCMKDLIPNQIIQLMRQMEPLCVS